MKTKKIQKKIQAQGPARAEVEKVPKANQNRQNLKLRFLNLKPPQKVEIKCDLFLHASFKYIQGILLLMHEIKKYEIFQKKKKVHI